MPKCSFILRAVRCCSALGLFAAAAFAGCGGSNGNISYACDATGLTSLQYNGVEYFDPAGWARSIPLTFGAKFSDGTQPGNKITKTTSGDTYSSVTFGANPSYSYQARFDYSTPDQNTLKITVTLSNLSQTNAISNFSSFVPITLSIPTPYQIISSGLGSWLTGSIGAYIVAPGVSIAYFGANFSDSWFVTVASTYKNQPDNSHDRWNLGLNNTVQNGPVTVSSPIPPQASKSVDLYVRFGPPDADPAAVQQEALTALRSAIPQQLFWPDRRPIATWFLSDYGHASSSNPRGWFDDPNCNCTDQPTFHSRLRTALNQFLTVTNNQPVRPQAVVLWDLEGQEFPQVMTYVGNPPLLPVLAPEMDAEVDNLMAALQANGYRVGMTLRPNKIVAGTPLPSSCNYDPNPDYTDRFLLTDGTPRARYYLCDSTGTFVNHGGIGNQMSYQDIQSVVNELAAKIQYAKNRWGASVFYVDSVVWSGGAPYLYTVWQQLQSQFPDCLFLPEEKTDLHYAFTAPYADAHQGNFWSSLSHRFLFPYGFAAINLGNTSPSELAAGMASVNGVNVSMLSGGGFITGSAWSGKTIFLNGIPYTIQSVSSAKALALTTPVPAQDSVTWRVSGVTDSVIAGIRSGDVYLIPGWYTSWQQPSLAALLVEAVYLAVVTDSSTGNIQSFGAAPGNSYTTPLAMTVTFADTVDDLAASTVSCAGGAACAIDLSSMAYFQLTYTDPGGNVIAQSLPQPINSYPATVPQVRRLNGKVSRKPLPR